MRTRSVSACFVCALVFRALLVHRAGQLVCFAQARCSLQARLLLQAHPRHLLPLASNSSVRARARTRPRHDRARMPCVLLRNTISPTNRSPPWPTRAGALLALALSSRRELLMATALVTTVSFSKSSSRHHCDVRALACPPECYCPRAIECATARDLLLFAPCRQFSLALSLPLP